MDSKKYIVVFDGDVQGEIFDSLDAAREHIAEDIDEDAEDYQLYELGQEWQVIQPSKKVLFKKV